MEKNKQSGLGERIIDIKDSNFNLEDLKVDQFTKNNIDVGNLLLARVITFLDESRQNKIDEEDLTIGTIDAIDDLIQRAINNIEEASLLFSKAMYKTNK